MQSETVVLFYNTMKNVSMLFIIYTDQHVVSIIKYRKVLKYWDT